MFRLVEIDGSGNLLYFSVLCGKMIRKKCECMMVKKKCVSG